MARANPPLVLVAASKFPVGARSADGACGGSGRLGSVTVDARPGIRHPRVTTPRPVTHDCHPPQSTTTTPKRSQYHLLACVALFSCASEIVNRRHRSIDFVLALQKKTRETQLRQPPCHTFGYPGSCFLDKSGTAFRPSRRALPPYFAGRSPAPDARGLAGGLGLVPAAVPTDSIGMRSVVRSAGHDRPTACQGIPPDDTSDNA